MSTIASTIELREIRTFLTIAEELHFGRTAERLSLTQSRISQTIRQLEIKVGGQLLRRTSRRVALTPLGDKLLAELRDPYEGLSHVLSRYDRRSDEITGTLKIASLTPLAHGPLLADVIQRFSGYHPGCVVHINHVLNPEVVAAVERGSADILVSWLPLQAPRLTCGPLLASEPRVLAVARDHPLAGRDSVTLDDIADYDVMDMSWIFPAEICEAFVPRFTSGGRPIRRVQLRAPGISELISLLAQGVVVHPTVAAYPDLFMHPSTVAAIPIHGLPPMTSALLWAGDVADPRVYAFVQAAREVLPAGLASGAAHAQLIDDSCVHEQPQRVATSAK
ncbi:MAG TPA: LysR family transcriptional regulator [Solirubrobacteraceae bacterium]|jgi:DNA-binding transcriptional LysR family regulator|nr:LysR family transcriptional regulator [Solirubrobacteraceae bacterium]